ncbi:outer membrane lipoprotein chaperone LolA [Pseudomarimonas arenosa]|uniref:Outer-membrane lipoprotein carrier protein n=1 Tax=Pseudomarimonas arenosa TaxID=2774145 RepID=A0AAW3ZIE7_9GAMM|nr:outer membrane lipoprotein chaperone LolA [Pseudomarimonas arenosa]MBD8524452.1 outer membrane lipoprotein chaperone LolA [Pseudomarimonas arenosa]
MSRVLLVSLAVFLAAPAQAELPSSLQSFSQGLKTLQGQFEQQVYDTDGQLKEQTQGTVALAAPRQFRWDYVGEFPQTIIADGDRVWIYDPELEQVSVRPQSHEEQSSPLAALIDPGVLEQHYFVSAVPDGTGGEEIELSPKQEGEGGFSKARLRLKEGALLEMEFSDQLQQRSLIRFSGWKRNQAFSTDLFQFTPPDGVDVIGDIGEGAEVYPIN